MTTSLFILTHSQGRDRNISTFHSIDLSLALAQVMWRDLWSQVKKFTSWKIQS